MDSKVYTIQELAAHLHVHPSTVYRMLKRHQFAGFKMGRDWRFNTEHVQQWVTEQERKQRELRK